MKKQIKIIVALFVCAISCAQVGINTTSPTNDFDVNGGVRVRSLTEGTVQSEPNGDLVSVPFKIHAFVVIEKSGNVIKQYGVSSVVNLGGGKYRCFFTNPMTDNDYTILGMGKNRNLSYDTLTPTYFEITVSSTSGSFDFNVMIVDLI
jgi:hypothetical protein